MIIFPFWGHFQQSKNKETLFLVTKKKKMKKWKKRGNFKLLCSPHGFANQKINVSDGPGPYNPCRPWWFRPFHLGWNSRALQAVWELIPYYGTVYGLFGTVYQIFLRGHFRLGKVVHFRALALHMTVNCFKFCFYCIYQKKEHIVSVEK